MISTTAALFALLALTMWLDPSSPLTVVIVLTVAWGVSVLALPWLSRLQQRRWLAYWLQQATVVDASCDFYCVPDRCALLQARCALYGQQREERTS